MDIIIIKNDAYTNPAYNKKYGYYAISSEYMLKVFNEEIHNLYVSATLSNIGISDFSNFMKLCEKSVASEQFVLKVVSLLFEGRITFRLWVVLLLSCSIGQYPLVKTNLCLIHNLLTVIYEIVLHIDDVLSYNALVMLGLPLSIDFTRLLFNFATSGLVLKKVSISKEIFYNRLLVLSFQAFDLGNKPPLKNHEVCTFGEKSRCYEGVSCNGCTSFFTLRRFYAEYVKQQTLFSILRKNLEI
jgi:hypothetical protein